MPWVKSETGPPMTPSACHIRPMIILLWCGAVLLAEGDDPAALVDELRHATWQRAQEIQAALVADGCRAVAPLCDATSSEASRTASIVPQLAKAVSDLDSDDFEVRERAERTLRAAGEDSLPLLHEAAEDPSAERRTRVQGILDDLQPGPWKPTVFRVKLLRALAGVLDDAAVPALEEMARIDEVETCLLAVKALANLDTAAARVTLERLAAQDAAAPRWSARAALLRLGRVPPGCDAASFVADWPPETVRAWLYNSIPCWESEESGRLLLAGWAKEPKSSGGWPSRTRNLAEDLLRGFLRPESLLPSIEERFADADALDREVLVEVARGAGPRAAQILRRAIADPEPRVRWKALDSLVRAEGTAAEEAARACMKDKAKSERWIALNALHVLLGREPGPFEAALHDGFTDALIPSLVRSEGADDLRRIHERFGPLSSEEEARALSAAKAWLDPALGLSLQRFVKRIEPELPGTVSWRVPFLVLNKLGIQTQPENDCGPALKRVFELRQLPTESRSPAIRSDLQCDDPQRLQAAFICAVLDDAPDLEEPAFRLLQNEDWGCQRVGRIWLRGQKTPERIARLREMSLSSGTTSSIGLWIEWEGRPAIEALLDRIVSTRPIRPGVLEALAKGPLEPADLRKLKPIFERRPWSTRWVRCMGAAADEETISLLEPVAVASPNLSESFDARCALARTQAGLPFVVRLALSTFDPEQVTPGYGWSEVFEGVRDPRVSPYLLRLLDVPDAEVVRWAARTLAGADPAAAAAALGVRSGSLHAVRRYAALVLATSLGQDPPRGCFEVIESADKTTACYALRVIAESRTPSGLAPVARLLTHPYPLWSRMAWRTLCAATGQVPGDAMRNELFIPREARAAWEAWIAENGRLPRSAWVAAGLKQAGYGLSESERLRAYLDGPWYLSAALEVPEPDIGGLFGFRPSLERALERKMSMR